MSVNELFSPNDFVLYAGSLNTSGGQTITGNLTVNGNEFLNGSLQMRALDTIYLGAVPNQWGIYRDTGANQDLVFYQNGTAVNSNMVVSVGTGRFVVNGAAACSSINFLPNDGSANFILNYYEFRNIPIFFAGPWGAPQASLLHIQRVGNTVTIMVDGVSAPNTAASTITGVPVIPASLLPAATITQIIGAIDGSVNSADGAIQMLSNGNITISKNFGNFAAVGDSGFLTFSMTYSLS